MTYGTSWYMVAMFTALNFYDFFFNQYCSNLLKKPMVRGLRYNLNLAWNSLINAESYIDLLVLAAIFFIVRISYEMKFW